MEGCAGILKDGELVGLGALGGVGGRLRKREYCEATAASAFGIAGPKRTGISWARAFFAAGLITTREEKDAEVDCSGSGVGSTWTISVYSGATSGARNLCALLLPSVLKNGTWLGSIQGAATVLVFVDSIVLVA